MNNNQKTCDLTQNEFKFGASPFRERDLSINNPNQENQTNDESINDYSEYNGICDLDTVKKELSYSSATKEHFSSNEPNQEDSSDKKLARFYFSKSMQDGSPEKNHRQQELSTYGKERSVNNKQEEKENYLFDNNLKISDCSDVSMTRFCENLYRSNSQKQENLNFETFKRQNLENRYGNPMNDQSDLEKDIKIEVLEDENEVNYYSPNQLLYKNANEQKQKIAQKKTWNDVMILDDENHEIEMSAFSNDKNLSPIVNNTREQFGIFNDFNSESKILTLNPKSFIKPESPEPKSVVYNNNLTQISNISENIKKSKIVKDMLNKKNWKKDIENELKINHKMSKLCNNNLKILKDMQISFSYFKTDCNSRFPMRSNNIGGDNNKDSDILNMDPACSFSRYEDYMANGGGRTTYSYQNYERDFSKNDYSIYTLKNRHYQINLQNESIKNELNGLYNLDI